MTKHFRLSLIPILIITVLSACNTGNPGTNLGVSTGDDPQSFAEVNLVSSFESYNDCVASGSGNAANVTGFNWSNTTGNLLNYSDGTDTGISVTMDASNVSGWSPPGTLDTGTDAYDTFGGIVNIDEIASYNSDTNWYYQVTFSGLDPAKSYAFITTANRNNVSYDGSGAASRWTEFTITGADSYQQISSTGVIEVAEDVANMNTGYNTVSGCVVAWTDITAADGTFTVRSENVGAGGPGEANKSYGLQAFKFVELAP